MSTSCRWFRSAATSSARHRVVAGDDERPRLALDDRVGVGPVVLAERVERGLDDGAERVEPGLGRLDVEADPGRPDHEVDRLGRGERAVDEQADRRGLGDVGPDLGDDRHRFPETSGRRRRQPFHEDLVDVAGTDPPRLDPDAARRRQGGLGLAAAGRVVAVGQQHDPFLGVVGEERGGQAQGRADVGRRPDRGRREPVDLGQVRRQPFDERLLAERDDPGDIARGPFLERLAQEGEGVLAAGRPDRIGQVDHEHGGQSIDRQDELEAGQGEDERREQDRPDQQRGPPAPRPDPPTCPDVQADGQRRGPGPAGAGRAVSSKATPIRRSRPGRHDRTGSRTGAAAWSACRGGRPPIPRTARPARRARSAIHSSSRVVGRFREAAAPVPVPGDADAAGAWPSASMVAAEPGAIVDSSTSNRSTAKRTGANGSTSGRRRRRRRRGPRPKPRPG